MFWLKNVKLSNFRCYSNQSFDLSPKINIVVGDNAVGKTSLIESVYVLGVSKSHKTNNDLELIKHNAGFCFVKGSFFGERDDEVIFSISNDGKRIVKNGKKINKLSEYLGYFYVVMFCPEDLELIKGAPSTRRKFLDVNIGQIDQSYLSVLINYKKVLKQRNQLLKDLGENSKYNYQMLEVLTDQLISFGEKIIEIRKSFIEKINVYFEKQVKAISKNKEVVKINYKPNCSKGEFSKIIKEKENIDLVTKTTNFGPHRDDFSISFNEKDCTYASQGQQKTFVLALKLALIDVIKEKSQKIIIILDDVFGELDIERQKEIIKLLDVDYQIFITTTTIEHLSSEILSNSKIIRITKDGV